MLLCEDLRSSSSSYTGYSPLSAAPAGGGPPCAELVARGPARPGAASQATCGRRGPRAHTEHGPGTPSGSPGRIYTGTSCNRQTHPHPRVRQQGAEITLFLKISTSLSQGWKPKMILTVCVLLIELQGFFRSFSVQIWTKMFENVFKMEGDGKNGNRASGCKNSRY